MEYFGEPGQRTEFLPLVLDIPAAIVLDSSTMNFFNKNKDKDMVSSTMMQCNMCDREFKSKAGLAGHKRMEHHAGEVSDQRLLELEEKVDVVAETLKTCVETIGEYEVAVGRTLTELIGHVRELAQRTAPVAAGTRTQDERSQHPHGICQDEQCQPCMNARNNIRLDTLNKIEERIPGVKEQLKDWEVMNSPITITENGRNP